MNIDKRLNLVLALEREDGSTVHIHSIPISDAALDAFPLELGRTYSLIVGGGLGMITGPRLAGSLLKQVATQAGTWEALPNGAPGVKLGFWAEMRRQSTMLAPSEDGSGWQSIPLDTAVARNMLTSREQEEVMGMLTFFTLTSLIPRGKESRQIMEGVPRTMWGAQLTSSDATAYQAGLKTSTPAASIGAKSPKRSSVPS